MKTTDSVMREKFEDKFGMCFQPFGEKLDEAKDFISHSLAEARREVIEQAGYKIIDVLTNDGYIRNGFTAVEVSNKVTDLLTGDNPESECKVCHRTSDVVDMSKCPFCEHDLELIREGRAMSDRDTRRGE